MEKVMRSMMMLGGLLAMGCSLTCSGQMPIKLKGRMHAIDTGEGRASVALVNGTGDTLQVRKTRSGRFAFRVAAGDSYTLAFQQPGSVTKEVVVDTRGIHRHRLRKKHQRIEFDVVMVGGDPHVHLRYLKPVGSISFVPDNGRMVVEHDQALELVDEEGPVQQN
jgi:hypothetical protein